MLKIKDMNQPIRLPVSCLEPPTNENKSQDEENEMFDETLKIVKNIVEAIKEGTRS